MLYVYTVFYVFIRFDLLLYVIYLFKINKSSVTACLEYAFFFGCSQGTERFPWFFSMAFCQFSHD